MKNASMKLSTKIIVPFIVIFLCFAGILVWVSVRSGRVLYDEKLLKTKHVVEVSYSLLDEYAKRAEKGEMTTEEAKKRAAIRIQNLRYDEKEYFWINDYDGPRNLDSVLSYTWEQKGGGPSGEFKEEAHAVI